MRLRPLKLCPRHCSYLLMFNNFSVCFLFMIFLLILTQSLMEGLCGKQALHLSLSLLFITFYTLLQACSGNRHYKFYQPVQKMWSRPALSMGRNSTFHSSNDLLHDLRGSLYVMREFHGKQSSALGYCSQRGGIPEHLSQRDQYLDNL